MSAQDSQDVPGDEIHEDNNLPHVDLPREAESLSDVAIGREGLGAPKASESASCAGGLKDSLLTESDGACRGDYGLDNAAIADLEDLPDSAGTERSFAEAANRDFGNGRPGSSGSDHVITTHINAESSLGQSSGVERTSTAREDWGRPEEFQPQPCVLSESHTPKGTESATVILVGNSVAHEDDTLQQDRQWSGLQNSAFAPSSLHTPPDRVISDGASVTTVYNHSCSHAHASNLTTVTSISVNPYDINHTQGDAKISVDSSLTPHKDSHQSPDLDLRSPQDGSGSEPSEDVTELSARSVPQVAVIETTVIMSTAHAMTPVTTTTVSVDITPTQQFVAQPEVQNSIEPCSENNVVASAPHSPSDSLAVDEKPPLDASDSCILEMKVIQKAESPQSGHHPAERCDSFLSTQSEKYDICRICHCEGEENNKLISPCLCSGSLKYIHLACLQKWIKSSDKKSCELCNFEYTMTTKTKPFKEWERLEMTPAERRKVVCSVTFHLIAITCVIWSLYVLIDRTTEEVNSGTLDWPFWTKLIVVAIGFTGGVVFMYVQCKMYIQLCLRWRAYNKLITVENAPEDPEVRAEAAARIKAKAEEQQQQQQQMQQAAVGGPGAAANVIVEGESSGSDAGGGSHDGDTGGGGGHINPVLMQHEADSF